MTFAHEMLFGAGLLCLLAILAGRFSAQIGTPLLLAFLALGMLAGEDGPGGIHFDDFQTAYFVGSLALAIILFEGGLGTKRSMLKVGLWPSVALATVGVVVSAGIVGGAVVLVSGVPWSMALLLGAVVAPTDAAAVAMVLRRAAVALPGRVLAALEIESGLNDPMSVFLTIAIVERMLHPAGMQWGAAALLFAEEMAGGAVFGVVGGYALLWLLRRVRLEAAIYPVLALSMALLLFGGAQSIGASGFLAVYIAGIMVGNTKHAAIPAIEQFFVTLGWLAQICLFVMLGLLVMPHALLPVILPALAVAAVVMLVARPIATALCLLPFGWSMPETLFVGWVGLRGAVPIYLTTIPVLAGLPDATQLFGSVFVIVIASVALQGWTIAPVARLLGLGRNNGE